MPQNRNDSSRRRPVPAGEPPATRYDDTLWWGPWLAAAAAILVYVNSLPGDFVYDDRKVVGDYERQMFPPRLAQVSRWGEIWTTHYWAKEGDKPWTRQDLLYRPLTLQTYAFNYLISTHPWHFHVVNVLLYGVLCFGIWHLARLLFDSSLAATAGTLLFAVHPLHTEVVANLVGRSELLAGGFITAALLCWYQDQRRPATRWLVLGLLAAACAMLSKESGLMLLPTAVLMDWWWLRRSDGPRRTRTFWSGRIKRCYLPLLAVAIAYLIARYYACGQQFKTEHEGVTANVLADTDAIGRALGPFKILGKYLALFIWPGPLSADYTFNSFPPPRSPLEPLTAFGTAATIAALAGAVISLRRRGEWFLMLGLFVFPYFLVSNSLILIGTMVGERLFFWPSMPLCLYVGRLAERFWNLKKVPDTFSQPLRWVGIGALVALAGRSMWRNLDWANDEMLTMASLEVQSDSAKVHMGMAGHLVRKADAAFDAGQYDDYHRLNDQARTHFRRALEIFPDYWECWIGVATTEGKSLVKQAEAAATHRLGLLARERGGPVDLADIVRIGRETIAKFRPEEMDLIRRSLADMDAYRQMYGTRNAPAEALHAELRSVAEDGQFLQFQLGEARDALENSFRDHASAPRFEEVAASLGRPAEPGRFAATVRQGLDALSAGRWCEAWQCLDLVQQSGGGDARVSEGLLTALRQGVVDPGPLRRYALLTLGTGKFPEAWPYLAAAHELLPRDEDIAIGLAKVLIIASRPKEVAQASDLLVGVLEQTGGNSWRARLELGLLISGTKPDSAVEHGKVAATLAPNDLTAQIGYARILAMNGRYSEAIRQYEHVLANAPDVPLRTRLIQWRIEELRRKLG